MRINEQPARLLWLDWLHILKRALVTFTALAVLTGVIYPLLVTGVAQTIFPDKAAGSLVKINEQVVGSRLIGQDFSTTPYFRSRPSATLPPYNGAASGATNYGPANPKLISSAIDRVIAWHKLVREDIAVPNELVTSSASGLDPHISVATALYQIPLVARQTGIAPQRLEELIAQNEERGFFGRHHYVNVLLLNIDVQQEMLAHEQALAKEP